MLRAQSVQVLCKLISQQHLLAVKALFFALCVAALEGLSTALVMPLLQLLEGRDLTATSQAPQFLQGIVGFYEKFSTPWQLFIVAISFFIVSLFKNGSRYLADFTTNDLRFLVGKALRQDCVERFLKLDLSFHSQSSSGVLLSYVNEQAQRADTLASYLLEIVADSIVIFALLLVLVALSPVLTAVTILSLTVVILLLRIVIQSVQLRGRRAAEAIEQFSSSVTELISGIRVIKSFSAESREIARTGQSLQSRYEAELNAYRYHAAIIPATETSGIAVLLIILVLGSSLFSGSSNSTLPLLLTYTLGLLRILPRINHLNSMRSQLALLAGSLDVIVNFLSSTASLGLPDGHASYSSLKNKLVFDSVTFKFAPTLEPTLKEISFEIQRGMTTAVVGPSGSGKSTLVDLVMRFHDPESGRITVDGIDLRNLQQSSWRKAIAMVSQDTFLFNTSVRDNIAYGCPDATETEVIEAAKKAYAYDFIQDLPQGFDTIVGNRGTKLSGGQRQRIAIARAILRNPDLLILDEATSALDTNSERIVQQAIEEVSRDRTVIVIAHRLSTIEKAGNIIVLHDGRVEEQGTHQELLALQGKYWSLYNSQLAVNDSLSQASLRK
jgi:ABC-type multidrug transport system fused ATPase/permease subunit